jgi:hypothetical protein
MTAAGMQDGGSGYGYYGYGYYNEGDGGDMPVR